ncbi:MAG: hypothetical protein ABEK10_05060 [Candidatus Nanosalina sp.]
MFEEVGKLMAITPLMLGLAVAMIGISNNPDHGITHDIETGSSNLAGAENIETISSHRNSNPESQTIYDRNHEKKERSKKQA